jgi:RNA polymerase sigma-70 factor (ECF subfamily)
MSGAAYPAADEIPDPDGASGALLPAVDGEWADAASPARAADFALLARARGGDSAAFVSLVERHHVVLASLVRQRGGPRAPVEDILQETFAKALAGMGGFRGRSSFLTWTATIALNLATDWSRKERRRARLAPRADVETDAVPGPASGDAAERREESDRARAALDALPEALRLAVTLRIVEDLTYEEVATRLGAPVPRVRTWVSRGLDRLRRKLEVRHD